MGLGRHEFLRLAALATAAVAVDPLKAVVTNDNTYLNRKLGLLFHKPRGWGFIAVKDFGKLKSEQSIGEGMEETPEEIWQELGEPICVATKYWQDKPELSKVFSPTITLNITPKEELQDSGFETFEEMIGMSAYGISRILKDFEIIKHYEPYLISNCVFYEFDTEYLFDHAKIDSPLKVELKVLKAEHNGFYYDFNCHQSKAVGQFADAEFEAFKKSIKLL